MSVGRMYRAFGASGTQASSKRTRARMSLINSSPEKFFLFSTVEGVHVQACLDERLKSACGAYWRLVGKDERYHPACEMPSFLLDDKLAPYAHRMLTFEERHAVLDTGRCRMNVDRLKRDDFG
jgi:hypothetical protein